MKLRYFGAACLAAVLVSGCRQGDGAMPAATGEIPSRLQDLQRDLTNVAAGKQDAPTEFSDDLVVFVETPDVVPAVRALASRVSAVLPKSKLDEQSAVPLANNLWLAVAATDLSEAQRAKLQADVKANLTAIAVADADAQAVTDAVAATQKAVGKRSRRWYELF